MKRKSGFLVLTVVFIALLMTGCGGGGGGSDSPLPLPSPPATVSATPGIGEVTINWTDVTGATSYNVYRSQTSPVTKATGTKTTVNDNTVAISGLDNGIKYYFVVTAVNANGESAVSVEVSATPVLPSPPTGVTALPGDTTATIRWTAVAGATSYNVYRSETSPVTKSGTKSTGTDNSLVITGLTNGTPYHFVVTVVVNGLESLISSEVTATPAPAIPPAPGAPINVTGDPGAGSATITWPPVATATSYNAYYSTSLGVTIATGTKVTGATIGGSIPNLIRGIPYYFVVTAVNAGGESSVSNEVIVTPNPPNPVFSLADLAGTWNVRVLRSGTSSGWYSLSVSVGTTGIVSVLGSGGSVSPIPGVPALSITTGTGASAGVVTEIGAGSNTTFHGKMSSGKNLIVGTSTQGTSFALHIFVKQVPGITFSSADLASKQFKYQRIYSGSNNFWEKATGLTDAAGQISIIAKEDSSGTLPNPPATLISVDGTGNVTIFGDPFSGVMTSDKKIIVGTSTDAAGKYSLRIIQMLGQTFTQADLAGTIVPHAFLSASTSSWAYATRIVDLTGFETFVTFLNSDGVTTFGPGFTVNIAPDGTISLPGNPDSHGGMLSFGKDLLVRIGDATGGSFIEITTQ